MPAYEHGLNDLPEEDRTRLEQTGLSLDMADRSGSYFQRDQSIHQSVSTVDGLEVYPISDALDRFDWLDRYSWVAVPAESDRYTRFVSSRQEPGGMVIIARRGVRVKYPVQACLYLSGGGIQHVHNIIIAEEGSELHLITGCASSSTQVRGAHYAVSEFYVAPGAHLTSTMIHNWGRKVNVFPRSAAIVGSEGVFLSNYVCMQPVRRVQMYPTAVLDGEGAVARFGSLVVATPGSRLDIGSRAILRSPGAKAELITRAISRGGDIISRGHIHGMAPETRGHIECRGLILNDGIIHAIPEIEGSVSGTELSHEAAVGKIARHEIEYLMARGLDEETATATIIRGFLDVRIDGLPEVLQKQIDAAIDAAESGF
ncbi:MAG: SufD family Fe-S cluster assembly protein [Methanoculleaceae archaeon]